MCKEKSEDLEINSNWKFQIRSTMSHKWRPLNVFVKLHKIPLLIVNTVKGTVSGLRQFLAIQPLKIYEKYFLFHLNKLNLLLANQILLILCIFIKPNVWYLWSLKILAIKRWFPFNFANILQGRHFVEVRPKIQTFSRHFFWELCSKYCIVEFTAIFVCLLLSWSIRYSMKWSSNFASP